MSTRFNSVVFDWNYGWTSHSFLATRNLTTGESPLRNKNRRRDGSTPRKVGETWGTRLFLLLWLLVRPNVYLLERLIELFAVGRFRVHLDLAAGVIQEGVGQHIARLRVDKGDA